jgi:uncharacterized protein (TIGR02118 family)
VTARFVAIYDTPADPAAFDEHYFSVHIPLAHQLPGLRRYSIGREPRTIRGDQPCYLIAELDWDTVEDMRSAFASPEGRATAEDAAHLQTLTTVRSMTFAVEETLPES